MSRDGCGRLAERVRSRVQRALYWVLARPKGHASRRRLDLPVCREGGGTLPGVNLDDNSALLDIAEGHRF